MNVFFLYAASNRMEHRSVSIIAIGSIIILIRRRSFSFNVVEHHGVHSSKRRTRRNVAQHRVNGGGRSGSVLRVSDSGVR